MSQGLDADMQSMTQAEKTMLRYQYVLANTGAASGDFLRTINSWHNQLVLLSGGFRQLGSIVGGVLINAFKPFIQALNSVMGAVINFAQVVSDALGAIFGWEYQTGGGVAQDLEMGAGAAQDIEDATGGAADNAKKLNKYIAGWHEVNNMTSNKDSGGSGGGGGAGGGGLADADGGKWIQKESLWEKYTSSIDSLYELGDYIGGVLTDAMNSIDWNRVYESARNFGSGLASFLNGLISPELFGATGRTIAGALNTAIYAALSFGETFDWTDFGDSIASGVNNFFATFDFGALANTIDTWVQGIWTTIKTAVQKIEWKTIWDGITEFISEIDLETISIIIGAVTIKKIGKFIFGGALLRELAATFGVRLAAELGTAPVITTLTAGIKALFGSAAAKSSLVFMFPGAASIVSGVSAWVTGTLLPALSGFGSMIASAISGPWGLAIAAALAGVFAIITNWDVVYAFFTETLPSFWNSTAVPFFSEMFSPLGQAYENHIKPLIDSIINGFGSIYKKFKDGYNEHMKPVLDDLGEKFSAVWDGIITPILENAQELFGNIGELFSTVWENDFQPSLKLLGDAFGAVADVISVFWKEVLQPCIEWIADNFWPMISPAVEAVGNIFISVFEQIGKTIDGFMTILNGIITFIAGVFSGDWSKAWEGVKTVFKGVWDAMPDFIKGPIKLIIGFVNSMIGAIENGINFVVRGMNNLQFDVPDWVPGIGGETFGFDLNEISLPRIPQLARGGVLEKGQVGLLEGNGAEAVVPLEKNTKWISRVAATMSDEFGKYRLNTFVPKQSLSSNSYNYEKLKSAMQMERDSRMAQQQYEIKRQNQLLEKLISVVEQKELHIGDDDIFNATRRGQNRFAKRTFKTGWAGID